MRFLHSVVRHAVPSVLLSLLVTGAAYSQGSSPLDAPTTRHVGIEAGISSITQKGIWRSGCGEFTEGSSISPLFAIAYDGPISGDLRYEGLLGYRQMSLDSRYNIEAPTPIRTESGVITANVQFENRGRLVSSALFLLPSVRYSVLPWLYVGVGASAGLTLSTTTEYTQEILTRVVENGSTLTEVVFAPGESTDRYVRVLPEEDRTDASSLLLDGIVYLGADFRVAERWTVGPRVMYSLPLTPLFADPELTLESVQLLIGVRRLL